MEKKDDEKKGHQIPNEVLDGGEGKRRWGKQHTLENKSQMRCWVRREGKEKGKRQTPDNESQMRCWVKEKERGDGQTANTRQQFLNGVLGKKRG